MNTLLILPVHSFVDLITNSSSELFVCETKQKIAAFKKTITKLAELHNAANALRTSDTDYYCGDLDIEGLFRGHFRNPRIQPYTFRLDLYPKCAEWRSICDWRHDNVHPVKAKAEAKMDAWRKANPTPKYNWSSEDTPEKRAYTDHQKKENAARTKIFAKWNALQDATETELYRWVFAQNGLDWDAGKQSTDHWRRWERDFDNDKAEEFKHDIGLATTYNFGFNAGDIWLQTSSDNTVPCGFFDDIQRIFRCNRVHLG